MAKWKYAKPKKVYYSDNFLQFETDEEKKLVVSNWSFDRSSAGYLFKCYVEKEADEPIDKIWCVWDFDSAERLKKKLGAKYTSGSKELTAVMKLNDDDQQTFEIK